MNASQRVIAQARERFIECGQVDPRVRPATINGWRRSKAAGVAANGDRPWAAVLAETFDEDSALLRAVGPAAATVMRQISAEDMAMVLVDRDGIVVARWASGALSRSRFEAMGVQLGSSFDESRVGSNGLGTALETGAPAVVAGAEHWSEVFDDVTAVGAPIVHPGTGVIEGAIDLVGTTGAPVDLMLPIIRGAAQEAAERLLNGYAREDRELLNAFLRSDRRGPRRPVIAINGRMMMANTRAGAILSDHDLKLDWERVEHALVDGDDLIRLDGEDGGPRLEGRVHEVRSGTGRLGALIQLRVLDPTAATRAVAHHRVDGTTDRPLPDRVPASLDPAADVLRRAVGSSLRWRGAVAECVAATRSNGRLLILGPQGTGRSHLAACLATSLGTGHATVTTSALPAPLHVPPVIVLEVDEPDEPALRSVCEWMARLRRSESTTTVIATLRTDPSLDHHLVAGAFDDVVELPSLAERMSDVEALVAAWSHDSGVHVEAGALHALRNRTWPGNVAQLFRALDVAASRGSGHRIELDDLPAAPAVRSIRRNLTYLENAERNALEALLKAAGGNKLDVARELGIARSTLYRKLAALGLND